MNLEPVIFILADLELFNKVGANKYVGPGGDIRPADLRHVPKICHWALKIRNTCYEVTNMDYGNGLVQHGRPTFQKPPAWEWFWTRDRKGLHYQTMKVGATRLSDNGIQAKAEDIWQRRFHKEYKLHRSNCQNFVDLLLRLISIRYQDPSVLAQEKATWYPLPDPLTIFRQHFKFALLLTGAVAISFAPDFLTKLYEKDLRFRNRLENILGTAYIVITLPMAILGTDDRFYLKEKVRDKVIHFKDKYLKRLWEESEEPLGGNQSPINDYGGYDVHSVQRLANLGFSIGEVESSLRTLGIDSRGGQPFELDAAACAFVLSYMMREKGLDVNSEEQSNISSVGPQSDVDNNVIYAGYNKASVDNIARLGFPISAVVNALLDWKCDTGDGAEFTFSDEDLDTLIMTMCGYESALPVILD